MGRDFVQQQDRAGVTIVGDEIRMSKHDPQQQSLLLTCRAGRRRLPFAQMNHGEIGTMWAGEGSPGGGIAPAPCAQFSSERGGIFGIGEPAGK